MKQLRISPAALADLDRIWDYTATNWGDDQAERYLRKIQKACDDISARRNSGSSAEHVRAGYRKISVGSHLLFFRLADDGVTELMRILHQSMDVPAQLPKPE